MTCHPIDNGLVKHIGELASWLLRSYTLFGSVVAWPKNYVGCLHRVKLYIQTMQIDQFLPYINVPVMVIGSYVLTNPAMLEALTLIASTYKA